MLTGRVPYNTETESDFELMDEIVNREIKDPREFYPNISDKTISIVYSMIEKDKNKRIKNYIELMNYLPDHKSLIHSQNNSFNIDFIQKSKVYNKRNPATYYQNEIVGTRLKMTNNNRIIFCVIILLGVLSAFSRIFVAAFGILFTIYLPIHFIYYAVRKVSYSILEDSNGLKILLNHPKKDLVYKFEQIKSYSIVSHFAKGLLDKEENIFQHGLTKILNSNYREGLIVTFRDNQKIFLGVMNPQNLVSVLDNYMK